LNLESLNSASDTRYKIQNATALTALWTFCNKSKGVIRMSQNVHQSNERTFPQQTLQEAAKAALADEEQTLLQKRDQLLQQYSGEFVALYQGRVVGHGADDEELAHRMFNELGDVAFYIAKIEETLTVYDLPSPEVIR
jgi:hypothetical protein